MRIGQTFCIYLFGRKFVIWWTMDHDLWKEPNYTIKNDDLASKLKLKIKNMHNFMQFWINWLIYGSYKVNK